MTLLLRAFPLLSAPALLCTLPLRAQGEAQACANGKEGACEARGDSEDVVSYLQRFPAEAKTEASSDEASAATDDEGSAATFFRKGDEAELPLPGLDYPEQLRGAIWMDQAGVYGFSDTGVSAPDLLVSFHNSLNQTSRTATVSPGGPTWTWQNKREAYKMFRDLQWAGFEYVFEWDEAYTEARIFPAFHVFGYKLSVWSYVADFRMVLQKPAEGECPPKAGAPKEEVNKCALWLRKSWVFIYPVWNVYPVFRVLDEAGAPISPYYDEYIKFAKEKASPDVQQAERHLGERVQGVEKGLWFAGRRGGTANLGDVTYGQMQRAMQSLRRSMPSFGLF